MENIESSENSRRIAPENVQREKTLPAPQPSVIHVKNEGNGRLPFWILLAVIVGFMLPVCSCGVMGTTSLIGMSFLGSGAPVAASGVGDAVAIVRAEGAISSGAANAYSATGAISGVVIADLEAAAADPDVKAIVLRVDSPGGTVTGSAQIHEALLKIEKPIIVSMGGLAASGGYMISAPADYIIARPDTTTGSIGVIMTTYNVEELAKTVGVEITNFTSGPNKAIGSPWSTMTAEQEEIINAFIDETYDDFVNIVADGRGMEEAVVRELADGRIYSGRQAVENGLADELGNLDDAIAKAATLGGIGGEPRIVEYFHEPSFMDMLSNLGVRAAQSDADRMRETMDEFMTPLLEYRYAGQ